MERDADEEEGFLLGLMASCGRRRRSLLNVTGNLHPKIQRYVYT